MISKIKFGALSSGATVHKYRISNNKREYIELLDFGAAVHSVNVADKNGNISDVVLGVNQAEALERNSFEGITIGRCANRIAYGKCEIEGKVLQLECNMHGHHLHGASGNYGFKFFDARIHDKNSITFSYQDTGEGGYDNEAAVSITFCFNDQSELDIHYQIIPEETTLICPTNHTYFNLSGGDVRDHELEICSDKIVCKAESGLPCDGIKSVYGTPADFTKARTIRDAMNADPGMYFPEKQKRFDEVYVLEEEHKGYAAKLHDKETMRSVEVYTDMEALIIFNGIAEGAVPGKDGKTYEGYCGFCLETQFVPNAVNCTQFQKPVFRKGEIYDSRTTYRFLVEN